MQKLKFSYNLGAEIVEEDLYNEHNITVEDLEAVG